MSKIYRIGEGDHFIMENVTFSGAARTGTYEDEGVIEFNHSDTFTRLFLSEEDLLNLINSCTSALQQLRKKRN